MSDTDSNGEGLDDKLYGYIIRAAIGAAKVSPMFFDHRNKCWLCYCCRRMQIGPDALTVPGQHIGDCAWLLLWRMAREFSHPPWAEDAKELETLKMWFWQWGVEEGA